MIDLSELQLEILDYISAPSDAFFTKSPGYIRTFNSLAIDLAFWQSEAIPAYKKWLEFKKAEPEKWEDWREIVPFPVSMFKRVDVGVVGDPVKVWKSSGTTSDNRSQTPLLDTRHYDAVINHEWKDWKVGTPDALISLIPSAEQWPESSLAYMFDTMFREADPREYEARVQLATNVTTDSFDLDVDRFVSLMSSSPSVPLLLYGTSYAFIKLAEKLPHPIKLPKGSMILDTGGYKGIVENRTRAQFIHEMTEVFGLVRFINEYGMSELSSQFWSETTISIADNEHWTSPYWVRTQVVNPVTYVPDPDGVLVVYDLANVWVPFALQTEDRARVFGNRLWPLGRAEGAVAKGCSLTAEQALNTLK